MSDLRTPFEKSEDRHDPADHDCKGGVRGDRYPQPSLPAERDVVHSLSDTKGSDDTTNPSLPAERDEPVRTWFRDDCSCPVTDRHGDLCALSTDTTRRLCDHCEAHEAATPSVEALAEAWRADHNGADCEYPHEQFDALMELVEEPAEFSGAVYRLTRERNGQ